MQIYSSLQCIPVSDDNCSTGSTIEQPYNPEAKNSSRSQLANGGCLLALGGTGAVFVQDNKRNLDIYTHLYRFLGAAFSQCDANDTMLLNN